MESCGLIIEGGYIPCDNLSADPCNGFEIDPRIFAEVEDKIDFLVHSHPGGPPFPTAKDMESQILTDVPWAIIATYSGDDEVGSGNPVLFGDQLPIPPLLGRPFRHGVTDCYSLIRDWFRIERGVTIPDFPRTWGWWEEKKDKETGEVIAPAMNLYKDCFQEAGFRELRVGESHEIGDVFLAQIRSKHLNHGGVYVGHGRIMHHPIDTLRKGYSPQSLSREASSSHWMNSELFWGWIRYGD